MQPEPPLKDIIADAISRLGVRETARRLGTTEESTLRLALGQDVRAGTLSLAKTNAPRLGDHAEARTG